MAGTATVRIYAAVTGLASAQLAPFSREYQIIGVDEGSWRYSELAAEGNSVIDIGEVDTVTLLVLHNVSGGTTAATGLGVDLLASSWAESDFVLVQGEAIPIRPGSNNVYVKNLSTTVTCTYRYLVVGDNA